MQLTMMYDTEKPFDTAYVLYMHVLRCQNVKFILWIIKLFKCGVLKSVLLWQFWGDFLALKVVRESRYFLTSWKEKRKWTAEKSGTALNHTFSHSVKNQKSFPFDTKLCFLRRGKGAENIFFFAARESIFVSYAHALYLVKWKKTL